VEHQAALRAPRDLPDVLIAQVQPDQDAFTGAHRLQDSKDQLVWVAARGGRRLRPRLRCERGVGGDRVGHAVVKLEGGGEVAAVVIAEVDVLDLVTGDAVQQAAGLFIRLDKRMPAYRAGELRPPDKRFTSELLEQALRETVEEVKVKIPAELARAGQVCRSPFR
jgi:hypothetical protein